MSQALAMVALAALAQLAQLAVSQATAVSVSSSPAGGSDPLPEAFVSFSIEFVFFPDFAGGLSNPNTFSDNLLNNIANFTGTKPYIRVGGNTQDYAIYDATLTSAVYGVYNSTRSVDYPTTVTIGPSYFDSYSSWPDVKFIHGFNLGLADTAAGWNSLQNVVPVACKALGGGKLLWWEYGNEPDLYKSSGQANVRPSSYDASTYVSEWKNGTATIKSLIQQNCPDLATASTYGYYAPSFASVNHAVSLASSWNAGLSGDASIKVLSTHNYIGGAKQPGVTLQKTLMNHSSSVSSIAPTLKVVSSLGNIGIDYVLGETNSLYNEGAPGLSNAFGAALWGIDFNLWVASQNVRRVHMHQGTDYRYASWQPIETNKTTLGTKAPYYGNIAVAAFVGNLLQGQVQIKNLPMASDQDSAYAAYVNASLARVLVLNMREYNSSSAAAAGSSRPSQVYTFSLPAGAGPTVSLQRLLASGSDAISGITFDGWSYNYELDNGKPVRQANVTVGETLTVSGGSVSVTVPDSQAVILNIG